MRHCIKGGYAQSEQHFLLNLLPRRKSSTFPLRAQSLIASACNDSDAFLAGIGAEDGGTFTSMIGRFVVARK